MSGSAFLVTKFQKLKVTRPGQSKSLVTQICLGIPTAMCSPLSAQSTSIAIDKTEFLLLTLKIDPRTKLPVEGQHVEWSLRYPTYWVGQSVS